MRLTAPPGSVTRDSLPGVYEQILTRVAALPTVTKVAVACLRASERRLQHDARHASERRTRSSALAARRHSLDLAGLVHDAGRATAARPRVHDRGSRERSEGRRHQRRRGKAALSGAESDRTTHRSWPGRILRRRGDCRRRGRRSPAGRFGAAARYIHPIRAVTALGNDALHSHER